MICDFLFVLQKICEELFVFCAFDTSFDYTIG